MNTKLELRENCYVKVINSEVYQFAKNSEIIKLQYHRVKVVKIDDNGLYEEVRIEGFTGHWTIFILDYFEVIIPSEFSELTEKEYTEASDMLNI
jgi:hypothetical protein